jgi:Kelch motif
VTEIDSQTATNYLYAIGGFDGRGHALKTVEVYNFTTNTWSQATPMPTARGYLAVVAGTDGNVYAIGVTDGKQPLETVEVYKPATDTWSEFGPFECCAITFSRDSGTGGHNLCGRSYRRERQLSEFR